MIAAHGACICQSSPRKPGKPKRMVSIRALCLVAVLTALLMAAAAPAAEVQARHDGLSLNGRLLLPEEGGLGPEVTLLIHDTLGSADDREVLTLQQALLTAGRGSLAITLSLAVNDRRGRFECARPHLHRHEDGPREIAAWVQWLRQRGARRVHLLGLGRGANQAAWYLTGEVEAAGLLGGGSLLLVRPPIYQRAQAAADFSRAYGYAPEPLLRHAQRLVQQDRPRELVFRVDFLHCRDTAVAAGTLLSYYGDDLRRHTPALLEAPRVPTLLLLDPSEPAASRTVSELAPRADGERLRLQLLAEPGARPRVEALAAAVLGYFSRRATALVDSGSPR